MGKITIQFLGFIALYILVSCLQNNAVSPNQTTDPKTKYEDKSFGDSLPIAVEVTDTSDTKNFKKSATNNGGTLTFTDIGAAGYWARVSPPTSSQCTETHTSTCCRDRYNEPAANLSPYQHEVALLLRGPMVVEKIGVYQPVVSGEWSRVSFWNSTGKIKTGLTTAGQTPANAWTPGSTDFTGFLGNDCGWWFSTDQAFTCGPTSSPYCPDEPTSRILQKKGWSGSKIFLIRASMPYAYGTNNQPLTSGLFTSQNDCRIARTGLGYYDAPWIGILASELVRDGGGGFAACNCYSRSDPAFGDGCGTINAFEVVGNNEAGGNRKVVSSGLRSFQFNKGHLGGSICGTCNPTVDQEGALLSASTGATLTQGVQLSASQTGGAPVWARATSTRLYIIGLSAEKRLVQLAVIDPAASPAAISQSILDVGTTLTALEANAILDLKWPQGNTSLVPRR